MRVDSHQHFWQYSASDYAWISEDMSVLRRDYLPDDLVSNIQEQRFDGTVAVQARQTEAETRWLLSLAERNPFVLGVVGWVDLCEPDLGARLDDLLHPKLCGVRHVLQDEPDPDYMLRPEFRAGVAQLASRDLTYDLLVYPNHLSRVVELVSTLPEVPFVLDHLGKPPIRDGRRPPSEWTDAIQQIAAHEHVLCKVSGMVTEADWQDRDATEELDARDYEPYLDVIHRAFGLERMMFGSDWPVCLLGADYASVFRLVDDYLASYLTRLGGDVASAKESVFGGNAARFYGLESR